MNVDSIVRNGLCLGCGLCESLSGGSAKMRTNENGFLTPVLPEGASSGVPGIASLCPGVTQRVEDTSGDPVWGPFAEATTAWSTDDEIRYRGSSGGAATAIALDLLESGQVGGVLHVVANSDHPFENAARVSTNREELLDGASSRYAPASMFHSLLQILEKDPDIRLAVIGKPCDIGAIRNLQRERPELRSRIPWTIGIFCAGMPSYVGTSQLAKSLGLDGEPVSVVYRGRGWPGKFVATSASGMSVETTYNASWGTVLNRHLHHRCKICPDGIGLQADFAVGDAWKTRNGYPDFEERPGTSLVLARTARAADMLRKAVERGSMQTDVPLSVEELGTIQSYQKDRRRFAFYRILGYAAARLRLPGFSGMRLTGNALRAPLVPAIRQAYGMWKRSMKIQRSR